MKNEYIILLHIAFKSEKMALWSWFTSSAVKTHVAFSLSLTQTI